MKKFLKRAGKIAFTMVVAALIIGAAFGIISALATFLTWLLLFIHSTLGYVIAILLGLITSAFVIAGIEIWLENHNED